MKSLYIIWGTHTRLGQMNVATETREMKCVESSMHIEAEVAFPLLNTSTSHESEAHVEL